MIRGFEDSDYPGYGTRYVDVCTPRNYDLLRTLQRVKVDKQYNIWIYPFDVPVSGGASAQDQIRRLEARTQGTKYQETHLYGPVDFLLRIRGFLDPRAPYLRVDPESYFAAWITGKDEGWTKTPNTFDNWKPDDLVLSRSAPSYSLEGPSYRGQQASSRPEFSHDSWMQQPPPRSAGYPKLDRSVIVETTGGYSAAASGGLPAPLPPPTMSPPSATPLLPSSARRSLGGVVDEKVKAVEGACSGAGRDSGKRALAAPKAADTSASGLSLVSRHMLPTGLEMNGN